MKWKIKPTPTIGTVRIVKRFPIIPVTIGLDVRWLETVYIKQTFFINGDHNDYWRNDSFIEHSELIKQEGE